MHAYGVYMEQMDGYYPITIISVASRAAPYLAVRRTRWYRQASGALVC